MENRAMTQLSLLDEAPGEAVSWQGMRNPGLDRLDAFLPRAGRAYASSRNFDLGPPNRSNISCLSPWIRHRLIMEEEVLRETLARHSLSGAEKFIQEVFWRTYFKGWLEQRPSTWTCYRADVGQLANELDRSSDSRNRYESAIKGQTGIDCFDAWTHELVETGYLHNHSRMWFASIWIFTLHLPWQLGADFFFRHLLDGDPASNTLSWRWVAGLHTKGKNYIARKWNIEKYSEGRFSPIGLVGDAEPLTVDHEHPLVPIAPKDHYDDGISFGLIITEEDCQAETLTLPGTPTGICSLYTADARSPLSIGEPVKTFASEALDDALKRSEACFGCPVSSMDAKEWGLRLVDWAKELNVKTLVTAYVPVGPVRDKLECARPDLENAGINLVYIRRSYDEVCWPHANKGFYKLRANIPSIVRELNLI